MSDQDFSYYQSQAVTTAIYRNSCSTLSSRMNYVRDGLVSEVGEICDKFKKFVRDDPRQEGIYLLNRLHNTGTLSPNRQERIEEFRVGVGLEIGDCLWYLALLADELGLDFHDIMVSNLKKLDSRYEKGTLQGSGDHR